MAYLVCVSRLSRSVGRQVNSRPDRSTNQIRSAVQPTKARQSTSDARERCLWETVLLTSTSLPKTLE